jgi:hypothetical protein
MSRAMIFVSFLIPCVSGAGQAPDQERCVSCSKTRRTVCPCLPPTQPWRCSPEVDPIFWTTE